MSTGLAAKGNASCTPLGAVWWCSYVSKTLITQIWLAIILTLHFWKWFRWGEEQTYVVTVILAVLHRWLNPSSYGIHCRQTSCENEQLTAN